MNSGGGQDNILVGNTGDDTFDVGNPTDVVQVAPGLGGVDSIAAYGFSYTLPANVQNLMVTGIYNYAAGNSGDNLITVGNDNLMTLYGGGGNDVLVGGYGQNDTFVDPAGTGNDVIYNFNSSDHVRLPGTTFTTFAQVTAAMTQVGADVRLQVDPNDVLIFRNMTIGQFKPSNFLLKFDPSVLGAMTFDAEFSSPPQLYNFTTNTGQFITNFGYGLNNENSFTLTNNAESEVYVSPSFTGQGTTPLGLNPFSTSNGVLHITASMLTPAQQAAAWGQPIASGMLSTEGIFEQKYGFFEMDAQLPATAGAWPAFWMINDGGGQEADIGENRGATPNVDYVRDFASDTYGIANPLKSGDPSGFHTYGLLWTPSTLTYYYDGYAVMQTPTPAGWTKPMYMILNLAFGGWGGSWSASSLPADMQVAWVKAYALADGSSVVSHGAPPALANQNMPPPKTGSGSGTTGSSGAGDPPAGSTGSTGTTSSTGSGDPPTGSTGSTGSTGATGGGAIQAVGGPTALSGSANYTDAELLSNGTIALTASSPLGGGAAAGLAHEYDSGSGAQLSAVTLQGFAGAGMTMDPTVSPQAGGYWEVTYGGSNAPQGVEVYNSTGQLVFQENAYSPAGVTFTPMTGGGFTVTEPGWNGQFGFITAGGAWDWITEQTVGGTTVAPSGVQALSNGGFAAWYQNSSEVDVYNSSGGLVAAAHLGAANSTFAMNTAALPGGDFAAAWLSPTGSSSWELEFQTFNSTGQPITAATGVTPDLDPWHTQIKVIPTGQPDQAVLLWSQGGAVWGVTATGSTVGAPAGIVAGSLDHMTETPLSDGQIALAWLQTDNGVQDLWTEVLNPTTMKGVIQELGPASGDVRVISTGNGGFAASWQLNGAYEARGYDGHGDYGATTSVVGDFLGLNSAGQIVAVGPDGHGGAIMQHYSVSLVG